MELRKDCRYALVIPTSMGIRITPAERQPVHTSALYTMQATSAESNVGNIAAALGERVKLLTTFVKESEIALFIKGELRRRNLEFEGPEVPQGGPWGYRHQFNIADSGFGMRGPRVLNDRAGEVGRTLNVEDFDLDLIFNRDGAAIVHMSGLIAAISPETSRFCLEIAKAAKKAGTLVSFDLNYRASFWVDRESELREIFSQIASLSDILVGNEEDFQLALGIEGPNAGGDGLGGMIDGFKEMIHRVKSVYPNVSVFATTLRQVLSAGTHLWGSVMLSGGDWYVIEPREIEVFDRIGGGDGFVGGLLYAVLKGWEPEKWSQFGWAAGALAATLGTDYAQPASEEQVWSIYQGNARVKR
ncbi:2-dehydro-3-deoxygluconokinase [Sporobacter termitidis DSM 10068]|uniref:2-dehydro-3-deoxygluconokinase n=1 Tax=Sporobacter termitidis DSM 10068 TaxID=1123282 RepID=A0A1M5YRU6_9FIRM|nr:PfkB family carbohydrate kinase [Sporobacter termitidis]SHI14570.1 2-dehydro-3-deoxygluconokinase [Sporobacter termitidis DSM 10068]